MLACVVFGYVGVSSAAERISKEEDDGEKLVTSSSASLAGRLEQLYLNTQT